MTVSELREALARMPDHWPVFVAEQVDGSGGSTDEQFLFTLECVPEAFPTQGCMAVVRVNHEPR